MRYLNLDVLLFAENSTIPLQEFRTQCFAYQDGAVRKPCLCSYIPDLGTGAPFQISVHSWEKRPAILGPNGGYAPDAVPVWRVKVAIDGMTVVEEIFGEDVAWPKLINRASAGDMGDQLVFPEFRRALTTEHQWSPVEDRDHIKIQVSGGYLRGEAEEFIKVFDHAIFSFQAVPLNILELTGIAWPNPNLPVFNNPIQVPEARRISVGNPQYDDASSRSTSAYSTYPRAMYPPATHMGHPPMHTPGPLVGRPGPVMGGMGHVYMGHREPVHARLPSNPANQLMGVMPGYANSMQAPPLPQRPLPTPPLQPVDRSRGDSRYSDISMHASCGSFPSCTTEDASGSILHNNQPVQSVKGRKEGSSPAKRECSLHKRTKTNRKSIQASDADQDGSSPRLPFHGHGHSVPNRPPPVYASAFAKLRAWTDGGDGGHAKGMVAGRKRRVSECEEADSQRAEGSDAERGERQPGEEGTSSEEDQQSEEGA